MTILSSGEYRRAAFPIEILCGERGRVHPTVRMYSSVDMPLRHKSILSAIVFVTGRALSAIISTGDYRTGDLRHRSLDVQL
ncbi:hypothetical protein [Desulfosporosinus sp.]|uniref:hypothetical protein n=1 Tax=Desulfosporosinus sp. TaxID=157907 RepID=UPI002605DF77|nr:hypothetical protein [Desulfosporosinus sp.]